MDLCLKEISGIIQDIHDHEKEYILAAAHVMTKQIEKGRLIYIFGPGGHPNPAAMEIFFRASGLIHVSAMLNQGTMLSYGVLKPMQTECLPGFDRIIVSDYHIDEGDLLIVINAYGIDSATIDAALRAKENSATAIGAGSYGHAENYPKEHPARHPSRKNLHEVAGYAMDCKVRPDDVIIELPGFEQRVGALSTLANAYVLSSIAIETINILNNEGIKPSTWMNGNVPGGDKWNNRFMQGFRDETHCL